MKFLFIYYIIMYNGWMFICMIYDNHLNMNMNIYIYNV